jgi:hypothetical protein
MIAPTAVPSEAEEDLAAAPAATPAAVLAALPPLECELIFSEVSCSAFIVVLAPDIAYSPNLVLLRDIT